MLKKIILRYALENAVKYNGKANINSVAGKIFSENKELGKKAKQMIKEIQKIINEVNSLNLQKQKEELAKFSIKTKKKKHVEKRHLPKLQNVKGKVVMRIAPFPSGPLHIGNARPAVLNDEYVKKHKGKLLLVIDDTIGSKEKFITKEAYKLIPEGLKWLNVKFDKIIYKSDRLEIYYKHAEKLIKKGFTYVCSCSQEEIRGNRKNGVECSCRNQSIEETSKLWKLMFSLKQGSCVLRIKTSMQHKNPAFRDRVLFRISEREHPKVKKKYKVWPLLEFSWAIDDHLLNITHILRGKELMMESEMERYIWKIFNWKFPVIIHSGLLQLEGVKISKTKSREEVLSGKYSGWDDPRTWSLQSLERRGFEPEAIRNFILSFGLTQTEITVPIDVLYSENKKLIEKSSDRYFFIENPKKIVIKNAPKSTAKIPLHPDYPKRGYRKIQTLNEFYVGDRIEKNNVYRFMHLFNFKNNKFISGKYDPELNAKLIHWLPVKGNVDVEVVMENGSVLKGLGESNLKNVKVNKIIQFERRFFAKCDKKEKDKIVFYFTHH